MDESSLDSAGRCPVCFHQSSDAKVCQCTVRVGVVMNRRSFSSLEPIVLEKRTKMSRLLHVASSCKFLPFRLSVIGRAGQARPKRLTRTVDLSCPARHVIRLSVAGCTRNHVFDSSVSILRSSLNNCSP
jgi:hypothetical protein